MPAPKVSTEASKLIREGKADGKSSRHIAEVLKSKLGIELDQRTVSIHMRRLAGLPHKGPGSPSKIPPPQATTPPGTVETTLVEVTALERQATKLQALLEDDMTPRDRAALTAELRQTFAGIRSAKSAQRADVVSEDADAAWVVAKLKHFDRLNRGTIADDDPERTDLPEAVGAETGG